MLYFPSFLFRFSCKVSVLLANKARENNPFFVYFAFLNFALLIFAYVQLRS